MLVSVLSAYGAALQRDYIFADGISSGSGLMNLNGGAIQPGTVSSNALDVATKAQLALAGDASALVGVATLTNPSNQFSGNFTRNFL